MKNVLKRLDPFLKVESVLEESDRMEFVVFVSSSSALCPTCGKRSFNRHSSYMRKISDLPIEERKVFIHVKSYKWFCKNSKCERQVFTERLPWIAPYRRRTQRLENALREVAFSTNAMQAEKVCRTLGMPVSHDSLLRLIYKTPLPKKESPFRWY
ncbi:transposase family protein [Virgibacillus pantothenticus]|uniref:transposase family protein n=1 Tax=Virgibacillus pantothenticus TaxID=1473 RepID=UPI000984644D|nr:transposase family protein [Virgibacillus pantothenticus]